MAATVLAFTANTPSRTITLQEAVQWQAGDAIVLVSTVWKDEYTNQNEVRCRGLLSVVVETWVDAS